MKPDGAAETVYAMLSSKRSGPGPNAHGLCCSASRLALRGFGAHFQPLASGHMVFGTVLPWG
jgi:hypothetical protein